ncbi:hypothetical protein [Xanthomonas graminis]|uniref:Peptidase C80 domain-containing protein n=1 Tax=Xanthomonas graminis pv. poae TaxID=227946 RepID=A0A199P800_9XANT|nr:hypothetical protein [Xanthomonas translucens]OAX57033.1 hypothetical protein A6R73_11390 [Xanthomonas translucens pv. poae]
MLIYVGLDGDQADQRGAKLKALQAHFGETESHALNMLSATALAPGNKARGKRLVVNSHGNVNVFAGLTPAAFLQQLLSKGLAKESFEEIALMACQVGAQSQTNSIAGNFAKELKRLLVQQGIVAKLYAPRGTLTYVVHQEQTLGQRFYVVDSMHIACPERNYPLQEGLLLVQ